MLYERAWERGYLHVPPASTMSKCGERREVTDDVRRNDYCFTCSQDQNNISISLWDVETGTSRKHYSCETASLSKCGMRTAVIIALLGSNYLLCAPRTLPFIFVWNLMKEQLQQKISCSGVLSALTCSPDQIFCAGAIEEKINIWQVCTGHLLAVVCQHYQVVNVLRFTDDGTYLLSGGADARVLAWKFGSVLSDAYSESGHIIPYASPVTTSVGSNSLLIRHVWSDHSLPVTDIHCGSGGHKCRVATVSLDQTCKLYELASGQLLCSFLFGFGLTKVTMDLAEHRLFVGGVNGSISQMNLFSLHSSHSHHLSGESDKRCDLLFNAHSKPITGLVIGRWSQNLISSSEEDSVRVWDIVSRQVLRTVKVKGPVYDLLLTGSDLSPLHQHLSTRSHLLNPSSRVIQPFHKQPYFISLRKEDDRLNRNGLRATTMPITTKTTEPMCDLPVQVDYSCLYSIPAAPCQNDTSITIQSLKQEISEVKDVHKRLYDFLMDSIPETK